MLPKLQYEFFGIIPQFFFQIIHSFHIFHQLSIGWHEWKFASVVVINLKFSRPKTKILNNLYLAWIFVWFFGKFIWMRVHIILTLFLNLLYAHIIHLLFYSFNNLSPCIKIFKKYFNRIVGFIFLFKYLSQAWSNSGLTLVWSS